MMKRFEVGHTYYDQYACDHETLSVIKIVKRTPKTVVFERHGKPAAQSCMRTATVSTLFLTTIPWPASTAQNVSWSMASLPPKSTSSPPMCLRRAATWTLPILLLMQSSLMPITPSAFRLWLLRSLHRLLLLAMLWPMLLSAILSSRPLVSCLAAVS